MKKIFSIVLSIIVLLLSKSLSGQNVHPSVQAKIDSLQTWMQNELSTKGKVDPAQLEEWNARIRKEQERVRKEKVPAVNPNEPKDARTKSFSGYVGTTFTVPEGKKWRVKKVTCSGGMGEYSILVTSIKFDREYQANEKIATPSFSTEASLLTNDPSAVLYTFEIIEYDIQ